MMFKRKNFIQFLFFSLMVLLLVSAVGALASSNTVPISYADDINIPIDQSQFIPSLCVGMNFDHVIYGVRKDDEKVTTINGTKDNDLIYGTDGDDKILAGNGDDCIIAGDGDDEINGQNGDDVIDGGLGTDTISGGPGTDTCINGEIYSNCEF